MSRKSTKSIEETYMEELENEEKTILGGHIDKYLSIAFHSHFDNSGKIENAIAIYRSFTDKLMQSMGKEEYIQIDDEAWKAFSDVIEYVSVEAMKFAISIESQKQAQEG